MRDNLREELLQKSEQELRAIALANGITVQADTTKEQLVEIVILASENDLPEEGKTGVR